MFKRFEHRSRYMITYDEIIELINVYFREFTKTVETLDKSDLVAVRRGLRPIFNEYSAKKDKVRLAYHRRD